MRSAILVSAAVGAALAMTPTISGVAQADSLKIQTTAASYGYGGKRKDVKGDVAKYCDGKTGCSFKVTNENLAMSQPLDPSPGDDKGLFILWKCGETAQKEQFAEGRDASISCK